MGATVSRTDFTWSEENEPHAVRRKEILGKLFVLDCKVSLGKHRKFELFYACWLGRVG